MSDINTYAHKYFNLLPYIISRATLSGAPNRVVSSVKEQGDVGFPGGKAQNGFFGFKASQVLQLFFGEQTLNKVRLLDLYRKNVPDFKLKTFGELIIRELL